MNDAVIRQAPDIIAVLSDPANFWINVVLAGITLLAVLVALFQEKIRGFWRRAVLDMEINLFQPDCHQIALTNSQGQIVGQTIYIRIKVVHKKGSAAENVEIMPINFWLIEETGGLKKLEYFLPISLVWSHFQPRTNVVRVPVGLFRHCDFGHFLEYNGKSILRLDTMVQPNPVSGKEIPNVIKPGKYQFELLLSGDNVKSLNKKWQIEFENWSNDENEMLTKNIKLTEVRSL